ncbi:uncharacterized protein I303_104646 [Kwoniella dejecticola CBS 10117]|uniref:ARID domain-containing protein n=1 Tax=Kwoniella dejecticola CBS 10117 TaxID=1296121 RepID=A0A1A6A4Q8_9TREE|nr:uncharacterized protein I303_04374 [Kwoniella dejecticola CBS 10117]OBR85046.1 hypothetical protein I303_04374 [Kwoniella dejecticola CBS 10117]
MELGNNPFVWHEQVQSASPSKHTQPRRAATSNSTVPKSPSTSSSNPFYLSSSTPGATSASSSATPASATSQHPLAQPPITAQVSASDTSSPAPLPFLSLAPPQVNFLRGGLARRRSSYPPATTPGSGSAGNLFPWVMGGTPGANGFDWGSALDSFPGFNLEIAGDGAPLGIGSGLTPGSLAWDTLLNFGQTDVKPSPSKIASANLVTVEPIASSPNKKSAILPAPRAKSDPLSDNNSAQPEYAPFTPQQHGSHPLALPPANMIPSRVIQLGTDLAWRTALASVVEVDGVGQVTVAKVLQEVWRRGGGVLVTSQCLWPSIVIALSLPNEPGPGVRVPNPSAQSAMALQQLYNLSIRHWEPAIFTGLLGSYASPSPDPASAEQPPASAFTEHYGPSTPLREPDVSQWMNLTPSGWNTNALFGNDNDSNSKPGSRNVSNGAFPFPLNADLGNEALSARRTSLAKTENGEESNNHMKSIDEILASMEEGNEEHERAIVAANLANIDQLQAELDQTKIPATRQNSMYQFPTPETDSSHSPPGSVRRTSKVNSNNNQNALSPVSMTSPFVTANSNTSSLAGITSGTSPTPIQPIPHTQQQTHHITAKPASLKTRPSQLPMPPVEFIPPPPMCMFFNPSFENLTDGKTGIWRGDLEVRGRGGGKFPILVIGEKDTEHLWQSHLWPKTLTYPLNQHPVESCTSTMIPVSHLAREGLVPITMGMVLCNETPERLAPYVNMVQGLHAEGVGFHLPCETRLPIVFLPSKFHSTDPLLRLGIAFMGKTGYSHPNAPLPSSTHSRGRITSHSSTDNAPKKKKRRQSAPASAGHAEVRGRKKRDSGGIVVLGQTSVGKIDEEGE